MLFLHGFATTLGLETSLSGFVVGLLVGMTGVGGGSLMTPLLILLFGIHPMTAVGTDLLQASITKAIGSAVHGAHRTVEWRIVRFLLIGSLPATILTLLAVHVSHADPKSLSHLVSGVLGVALLLTALSLAFRPWITRTALRRIGTPTPRVAAVATVVTGAVIGVFVSLSSVGAGAIGVSVLLLLYPALPLARIVGSDIVHAVPLTLVAGTGHILLGTIDWTLLATLLIGSVPGVVAGSLLAVRVPEGVIRGVLATLLTMVGARLVQ